jgi:serine/threonine protein kinase/signal transduction histidine kinase
MNLPNDRAPEAMDRSFDTVEFEGVSAQFGPSAPTAAPVAEGAQLGKYQLVHLLGAGGLGRVYQALDVQLRRFVALKMMPLGGQASAAELERFRKEAEAIGRLQHPNIVQIFEIGDQAGQRFLALEYCGGGTLKRRLDGTPWPANEAAEMVETLARAVDHAHRQGIIHRDLKPGNILLAADGMPKISDFGLAHRLDDAHAWETGRFIGTPAYMAPEQAAGKMAGPAADIYALGSILYELITGTRPFTATDRAELIEQLQRVQPPSPRIRNPLVPADLEAICLRCLHKDPAHRYSTAASLADDLRRFRAGEPICVSPGIRRSLARWWGRLRRRFGRPEPAVAAPAPHGLSAILDSLSDGALLVDASGAIFAANAVASRILAEDLTGRRLDAWLQNVQWRRAEKDRTEAAADFPVLRARQGEVIGATDVFLSTPQRLGGVWLRLSAHPIALDAGARGMLAIFRDISAVKAHGDEETQHKSLWDGLRLNVFRKDLDGRFTFVNGVFCTTVGQPRDQVLGRSDFDFFRRDEAEIYRRADREVIENGQVVERIEEHRSSACAPICRCRSPGPVGERPAPPGLTEGGDDLRFVQSLLAPVYDSAGQVIGTQGIFWNITAQRRAERRLEELAQQLQRSNAELARSNADLEQFAYAASHDLQEPLRMVASFTKLLKDRYQGRLDGNADEYIAHAVDGATRMQALINDLLKYSRVKQGDSALEDVDFRQVFEDAVANLQAAVAESGAVVRRGSLPIVRGNRGQLLMLMQNLIGNAIKFQSTAPPRIHVASQSSGKDWLFSVEDNGIGIDPKHAERVFVIFQRLHGRDKYPGNGIGLALCKRIVECHGGRIWVEPRVQGGSVFYFTLAKAMRERP